MFALQCNAWMSFSESWYHQKGAVIFFGMILSLSVYLIGQWLFKKTNGLFIFQPLFVAMILGIFLIWLFAKWYHMPTAAFYNKVYLPGGKIIFWFLNPATIAFAIPLYRRNDIVKKYAIEILLSLFIGIIISFILMFYVAKLFGLSTTAVASMLPQAATTAIALPISTAIGGSAALTAMACILNAVIIYALGDQLIRWFKLSKDPVGLGLGLGTAGHTVGSAKALEYGSIEGSMAAIAVVIISVVVDIVVPPLAHILGIF